MTRHFSAKGQALFTPLIALTMVLIAVTGVIVDVVRGLPMRGEAFAIGRDFINIWTASRLALTGDISTLFDWPKYFELLLSQFGPRLTIHNWSYPPHVLLFTWPLGLLPYKPALIVWDVLGLVAFFLSVRLAFRALPAERRTPMIAAAMGAPAIPLNIILGQVGLFVGAMFIAAWTLRKSRPIVSGILFGMLTMKPHLGLLVPLILLAERRYLTIAAAVVTTGLLAFVTSALFGWTVFADYIAYAGPVQLYVLTTYAGLDWIMPTPMLMARTFGLPIETGWIFVGVAAPSAFVAFVLLLRNTSDDARRFAMLGISTFLILPYAFTYDGTLLIVPAMLLIERSEHWGERLALLSIYLLPYGGFATKALHLPVAVACLVLVATLLLVQSFGARRMQADKVESDQLTQAA